ncbi:MAG: 30S ribosome-binding factor RbfA [Flavobacteriales bacterium]|nr:30S ribosome-binding factor RbfA [Flavobacteriales bacterium]
MESTRQKKVARQIQKDVAEILLQKTPSIAPGALISVSKVRLSPDLSYAKVFLSVFPLNDKQAFLSAVGNHSAEVRNELGRRVRHQLRIVPELTFFIDDSVDYAENIDRLLRGEDTNLSE